MVFIYLGNLYDIPDFESPTTSIEGTPLTNTTPKGRKTFLLVAAVFIGPFVLAVFLYNSGSSLIPSGTTEHGTLIIPPRLLPELALATHSDEDGAILLRDKWSILYFGNGTCNELCQQSLIETRQVRRALGKEMSRVQRVFFVTAGTADEIALNSAHPDMVVFSTQKPGGEKLLEVVGEIEEGDIFLVDPIGNLMMRYSAGTGMKGMHADMKRLLKLSQIG